MMSNKFEYCVCIGRFQPFHHGHHELVKQALSVAKTALVIIGSAHKAPSIQNPFSALEREEMIKLALTPEQLARVKFIHVRDYWYTQNRWLTEVQQLVAEATDDIDDDKICDIGETSYFPQWHFFKFRDIKEMPHASRVRELLFTHDNNYKLNVSPAVSNYLEEFKKTPKFLTLKDSFDFIQECHLEYFGLKYPPTFVTTDAVVLCSGHVLVVRRKGKLGRGQLALPGGFLNNNETILTGVLRELKEETKIKVDLDVLESCIKDSKVFDYPNRSLRGRTVTHAFLINLGSGKLPKVQGADDADKAWWMSLSDLATREEEFFEDHFHIISHFTNKF